VGCAVTSITLPPTWGERPACRKRPVECGRPPHLRNLGDFPKVRRRRTHPQVGESCLIAWLVAALGPRGPYPVLALFAEQGSGKSMTGRILRDLVDPNSAPLRAEPRDGRDLMIAANNSWCLAYDNLSYLPPWLSDALCRLSTGGGFTTRELYTDQDEVIFDSQRPVLLTSIEEVATRSDLLDRCVIIYLPAIPEDRRRPEAEILTAFEAARPRIHPGHLHPRGYLRSSRGHCVATVPAVRRGETRDRGRRASSYGDGGGLGRASCGALCGALWCPNWCPPPRIEKATDCIKLHRRPRGAQRKRPPGDRRNSRRN
jgi:hypothetical protein